MVPSREKITKKPAFFNGPPGRGAITISKWGLYSTKRDHPLPRKRIEKGAPVHRRDMIRVLKIITRVEVPEAIPTL
jgi:hypothetical protein